jgi:mono/diheme cytochrome c family protein
MASSLRLSLTIALTMALASLALAKGSPARGLKIAERNCARCHAVGRTGASANPRSPPFRTLAQRYPLRDLEESLGEGIMVGHEGPDMPVFEFSPDQIADLMAYLGAIQVKPR